ncbi:hypothetical protein ACIBCM_04530 [Streptomyces sp. NPDC051018]|uniref:hypothetical protein n=1 Tax=Streptomyces sp. NPDC051018 TaxID=3365639 RepID=UPI00379556FD
MTTVLGYRVHTSPSPLRISTAAQEGRATVEVVVTNDGPEPAVCEAVSVTLPSGTGRGSLTARPEDISATVDDPAWAAEHRGGGVFALRPAAPGTPLPPGGRIRLTLAGIVVDGVPGTVTMDIAETAAAGGPVRSTAVTGARLTKAAPDALLEDFRPDRAGVSNGETVTLTWKCREGPDFDLFFDDQRIPVNGFISDGNGSWTSHPLTRATAFMLLASTTEDGRPVTYGLTTAVTVDVPDLEVGDLDANGTVRLFGQAQEIPVSTQSEAMTYFADTDGVLTGYVKTTRTDVMAELSVLVTPPGLRRQKFATQSWDVRGGTDNQEASLFVPVPKDATIRVVSKGEDFTASLTWFPLGTGPLREYTP